VTFLEDHFRDPSRLPEGQLHLADVDVAVQDQRAVVGARAPCPDHRDQNRGRDDAGGDDDPFAPEALGSGAHAPPPPMPRRQSANTPGASRRIRATSPAAMAWITRPGTVPTNSGTGASTP